MYDFPCLWETSRFPLQSKGKAQRRGKREMTYLTLHPFQDAKTSKASSCWKHTEGITPLVTLGQGTASMWFFQRLLEITPSGVEHKERAQISVPGIVALKLRDLMCEERNRHPQTYPRQCKSYILSVPNPGQEKRGMKKAELCVTQRN